MSCRQPILCFDESGAVVQSLDLSHNSIKVSDAAHEQMRDFAEELSHCSALLLLNLSANALSGAICSILLKNLNTPSLEVLNMACMMVHDDLQNSEAVKALGSCNLPKLRRLDLASNQLQDDMVEAMTSTMRFAQSLEEINLSSNHITRKTLQHLAAALSSSKLSSLSIDRCSRGTDALPDADLPVTLPASLRALHCGGQASPFAIWLEAPQRMAMSSGMLKQLQSLDISFCNIGQVKLREACSHLILPRDATRLSAATVGYVLACVSDVAMASVPSCMCQT